MLGIVVAALLVAAAFWISGLWLPPREEDESARRIAVHQVQVDAMAAALGDLRDGDCVSAADIDFFSPDLITVDAKLAIQPWLHGWIDTEPRVFLGSMVEAAAAVGGTDVFVGPRDVWVRLPNGAQEIWQSRTPLGRMVWLPKNSAARAVC